MKSLFTFVLALVATITFAQKDFQGKATYMSKTTMDLGNFGGRQMSEAQKNQIAARMKSMLEKTFILSFDKNSSIYKEDEKLAAPTAGGRSGFGGMMGGSSTKYKNTKDLVAIEDVEFFGKKFLVSDDMGKPAWEMGTETKKIGNYTCYKATLVKDIDPMDFTNMRRRGRGNRNNDDAKKDSTKTTKISEEIEIPKQLVVTAWYTPQIPVSNGPGEYWGLPGLILEVNSGNTTVLCTEIVINPSEKIEIKAPTKGKKITRAEYKETVTNKMEEMRQNFQRRGRGGRGGF